MKIMIKNIRNLLLAIGLFVAAVNNDLSAITAMQYAPTLVENRINQLLTLGVKRKLTMLEIQEVKKSLNTLNKLAPKKAMEVKQRIMENNSLKQQFPDINKKTSIVSLTTKQPLSNSQIDEKLKEFHQLALSSIDGNLKMNNMEKLAKDTLAFLVEANELDKVQNDFKFSDTLQKIIVNMDKEYNTDIMALVKQHESKVSIQEIIEEEDNIEESLDIDFLFGDDSVSYDEETLENIKNETIKVEKELNSIIANSKLNQRILLYHSLNTNLLNWWEQVEKNRNMILTKTFDEYSNLKTVMYGKMATQLMADLKTQFEQFEKKGLLQLGDHFPKNQIIAIRNATTENKDNFLEPYYSNENNKKELSKFADLHKQLIDNVHLDLILKNQDVQMAISSSDSAKNDITYIVERLFGKTQPEDQYNVSSLASLIKEILDYIEKITSNKNPEKAKEELMQYAKPLYLTLTQYDDLFNSIIPIDVRTAVIETITRKMNAIQ